MTLTRTLWALVIAMQLGCATAPPPVPEASLKEKLAGAPEWVLGKCQRYLKRVASCSAGTSERTKIPQLRMNVAETSGRAILSANLEVRITAMVKSYLASSKVGDDPAKDEQRTESISRQLTGMVMSGATVEESWVSPGGTLFVLMVVDGPALRNAVSTSEASAGMKDALTRGADQLLGE